MNDSLPLSVFLTLSFFLSLSLSVGVCVYSCVWESMRGPNLRPMVVTTPQSLEGWNFAAERQTGT